MFEIKSRHLQKSRVEQLGWLKTDMMNIGGDVAHAPWKSSEFHHEKQCQWKVSWVMGDDKTSVQPFCNNLLCECHCKMRFSLNEPSSEDF